MNPFEYASPEKLEDAIGLLSEQRGESAVLAGGTDLVTSLKQNIVTPERVVSLKGVSELKGIDTSGEDMRIGAMTSLFDISQNRDIASKFPSLIQAIQGIGSPQIIAMGTIGGDLCQRPRCWFFRQGFGLLGQQNGRSMIPEGDNRYHAIFGNGGPAYFVNPSSLAPALIALDASVEIAGPEDRLRQIKVADFFQTPKGAGDHENVLEPNQILTSVSIPNTEVANATYEVRPREGMDWPLATASVAFTKGSTARNAKVVLGHVAPVPWVASGAASVLQGQRIDAALAASAGETAAQGANPLSKNAYKVQLVKTAVKRAILLAAGIREV